MKIKGWKLQFAFRHSTGVGGCCHAGLRIGGEGHGIGGDSGSGNPSGD